MALTSERIEWVTDPARIAEVADDWDSLAAGRFQPFLSSAWFVCWWAAFGSGELRTCLVWRGDQLVGALPLQATGRGRLQALSNDHSPLYRPLASDEAALMAAVGAALSGSVELRLGGIPTDAPTLAALRRAAEGRGKAAVTETAHVSPLALTADGFQSYRGPRRHQWREIERRRRKLLREHSVEFRLAERPRELERQLERGLRLEAAGWKGRAGTSILSSESTAAFYRSYAEVLHRADQLRLSTVTCDGELIAFDLALEHERRYFLLKTAYDERHRGFAPGLVLRLSVIERCFELGLEAHEFLGGASHWKLPFATTTRRHATFRAYSRRPLPLARYAYRRAARPRLRAAYRAIRDRRGGPS